MTTSEAAKEKVVFGPPPRWLEADRTPVTVMVLSPRDEMHSELDRPRPCPRCGRFKKEAEQRRKEFARDTLIAITCTACLYETQSIVGGTGERLDELFLGYGLKTDWAKWAVWLALCSLVVSIVALVAASGG